MRSKFWRSASSVRITSPRARVLPRVPLCPPLRSSSTGTSVVTRFVRIHGALPSGCRRRQHIWLTDPLERATTRRAAVRVPLVVRDDDPSSAWSWGRAWRPGRAVVTAGDRCPRRRPAGVSIWVESPEEIPAHRVHNLPSRSGPRRRASRIVACRALDVTPSTGFVDPLIRTRTRHPWLIDAIEARGARGTFVREVGSVVEDPTHHFAFDDASSCCASRPLEQDLKRTCA